MTKSIRAALVACAALGALAFVGSALASYAPKLVVGPASPLGTGNGSSIRVGVVAGANDAPTAKVQIYVPSGYTIATPQAGTNLGKVTATASAADLGGAILPLTGNILVAPANPSGAAQCLGAGETAAQYWDLHLSAAGQTLDIPMYVVTASAGEQTASYEAKLEVCLPPPDVPAGTPGRATFGAKLLSATMSISAIQSPQTNGTFRWTSLWTPYNPGQGTVNAAGTVETQSVHAQPTTMHVTLTRKRVVHYTTRRVHGKKHRVKHVSTSVRFRASVTQNGVATTPSKWAVVAGKKRVGGQSGAFTFTGRSIVLTVLADVDSSLDVPTGTPAAATDLFYADLGAAACTKTAIFGGLPCIDATQAETIPHAIVLLKGFTA